MGLIAVLVLLAAVVILPVWAAETAAIRQRVRSRLRAARWMTAGSVAAAVLLLVATTTGTIQTPAVALLLWATLLAGNIGLVAWAYAARPAAVARGFPVGPVGEVPPPGDGSV